MSTVGVVAILAMLAGGAGPATAGSLAASSATAKCPKGTKAVGGGFKAPTFGTIGGPVVLPYVSQRQGKRRWTASGYNLAVTAGPLTSFAYCDKRKPKLKAKSTGAVAPPDENESATARCPRKQTAFSGGFATTLGTAFTSPDVHPFFESRRAGKRRWIASANQGFGGQPGPFEVFAYCGNPESKLKARSKRKTIAPGDAKQMQVTCARRARAISGGFATPMYADFIDPGSAIDVFESRRKGKRGWIVEAQNRAGASAGVLEAYVYCEKSAPRLSKRSATTTVPPQPD